MLYNFNKNYKDLPKTLPLFPLSKVLLLPRAKLPLNLFENRYLHMFDDALANGRCIGMIQPIQRSGSSVDKKNPDLYSIGCAGYITAFLKQMIIDMKLSLKACVDLKYQKNNR